MHDTGAPIRGLRLRLEAAHHIVSIGAGAGSYEPSDCDLIAVEPSRRNWEVMKETELDLGYRLVIGERA